MMKRNRLRMLTAACLAAALLMGTAITASAATQDEIAAVTAWLNGLTVTQQQSETPPKTLTADELQAYADEVFELVNKERESAGVAPLERDATLDGAAMIRAAEVKAVAIAEGKPHTRPDGTSYKTLLDEMGIDGQRCGENLTCGRPTPQNAMNTWMESDGHRKNILRDTYGSIGIGVYQRPDGVLDWVQIFRLK
jgi:uncharacterized protein YkwD